jgi:hypothetical protein
VPKALLLPVLPVAFVVPVPPVVVPPIPVDEPKPLPELEPKPLPELEPKPLPVLAPLPVPLPELESVPPLGELDEPLLPKAEPELPPKDEGEEPNDEPLLLPNEDPEDPNDELPPPSEDPEEPKEEDEPNPPVEVPLHLLPEQAHGRNLCLAQVNDPPVVLPGHGVEIALAQKALIVRLHQLVDGVGITIVLRVIHVDRTGILLSALYGLLFLIAADLFRHLGRCYSQRDHDEQDHDQDAEQEKALLVSSVVSQGAGWCRDGSHG